MTATSMRDLEEVIAELERKIENLTAAQRAGAGKRRWLRRPVAIAGVSVLALGVLAGVAGASGSTTNVSFTLLTPSKVLLSNVSIATHKTNSPVVIGGATTVPPDATTVELAVSAKGAASGTLDFYPATNVSGGSGQTLTYPSGNAWVTTTIEENVGQSGELTFYNAGTGTAVVSAKIVGYSTQVTAGDISPADGSVGQVLTNTGTGAQWSDPVGVQAYEVVRSGGTVSPNSQAGNSAACPAGKVAVGGGVIGSDSHPGEEVNGSAPLLTGNGWTAYVDNTTASPQTFVVYAVCVK